MASVLMLSEQGDGIPIALRLKDEGHIVKIHFNNEKLNRSFTGYTNPSRVANPSIMLDQYDLVLSDMVGSGKLCEDLKSKGKLVLGGGTLNDNLELDRTYGVKVMSKLSKASIPPCLECKTKTELYSNIKDHDGPVVVKPLDNKSTTLTLVSNDPSNRQIISTITRDTMDVTPCIMQSRIDGIEISTEGWFNKGWITFNHTIESKRLMEHNKGPNTGCMGNVVWTTEGDKLTNHLLEPLTPLLERANYIGPLDVNCIVNKQGAWFLELTSRFGYDAIQALSELIKGSLFDFLYYTASKVGRKPTYHEGFGIAVRLSVNPYPSKEGVDKWRGIQTIDISNEAKRHIMLSDVMMWKGKEVLSGVDGVIGCATARGVTVREAQRRVYRTIDNIVISEDVQYRRDIGNGVVEKIEQLKEWGWIDA